MFRAVLTILSLFAGAPLAGDVDFDTEVIPILTRAGCNAGSCHGAAAGRGGFKLSLLGADPAADHEAITRDFEGRRIDFARPRESLVLRKPTGALAHGGEIRLDRAGDEARTLAEWIRGGAPRLARRSLARLRVEPRSGAVASTGGELSLRAIAAFSDGSEEDVTARTLFASDDADVRVDPARPGRVRILRRGRSLVTARFLGAVEAVTITVPIGPHPVHLSSQPRANFIDEHVLAALAELRLEPAATVNDRVFARRASLALTGRLPAPERVSAYAADERPGKRARLVDELLAADAFNRYWAYRLGEILRVRPVGGDRRLPAALLAWLRAEIAADHGLERITRALLLAEGDSHADGPAGFHRLAAGPRESAELISEVFLGARLRCANCHDHPLDRWTQDDYHGLAAVFAGIERGRIVRASSNAEVTHPRTGMPARPRLPGERYLDAAPDPRAAFADWLARGANTRFARAIVNRLWKELLGRGLVEPADDLRDTNPPTHPALLAALGEDFLRNGGSLRHVLRQIALSETFARAAVPRDGEEVQRAWYTHATVRPLLPEVFADALSDVLDVPDRYGETRPGTRAVDLADPLASSAALDVLGRCSREAGCDESAAARGLERNLHLLNGPLINERLGAPHGRLARLVAAGAEPREVVAELFERALARPPGPHELTFLDEALARGSAANALRETLADIVWSLLASREFGTNH